MQLLFIKLLKKPTVETEVILCFKQRILLAASAWLSLFLLLCSPLSHCTRWCNLHPPSAGCCSSLCLGSGKRGTTPANVERFTYTHFHKLCAIKFNYECISTVNPTFSFSIATKEMASPILQVKKKGDDFNSMGSKSILSFTVFQVNPIYWNILKGILCESFRLQ